MMYLQAFPEPVPPALPPVVPPAPPGTDLPGWDEPDIGLPPIEEPVPAV